VASRAQLWIKVPVWVTAGRGFRSDEHLVRVPGAPACFGIRALYLTNGHPNRKTCRPKWNFPVEIFPANHQSHL